MIDGECCNPCCGDGGCKSKGTINIQSTNPDCLRVDTSECGVVKLEPTCPSKVIAGDNVTVEAIECEEGESCSVKYKVSASCEDEKVKACDGDTTPGYLDEKIEAGHGITITKNGCDGDTNSSLRISVDEDDIDFQYPDIKVRGGSKLINLIPSGHTLLLSDKEDETYNNMVCIGFLSDQNFRVAIDRGGNSDTPLFMGEDGHNWTIFTGNHDMATSKGIKILADGYYRLFGQITVVNNVNNDYYFNLGRGLLRVNGDRAILNDNMYLSTAKHGAYAKQMLLVGGNNITVNGQGVISYTSGTDGGEQPGPFDGPWMTFNIDTLVDLKKGDVITLGYRPQSNNKSNPDYPDNPVYGTFRFVGQNDSSTGYNALFGGTLLGCYQLAPKRFQEGEGNEVYGTI